MINDIKEIKYDTDITHGCETCDYGSSYIDEIEIVLNNGASIKIDIDNMYENLLSESKYVELMSSSKDINEFIMKILSLKDIYYGALNEILIDNRKINIKETIKQGKIVY